MGTWSVSGEASPPCLPASDGYTACASLPTASSQTKRGNETFYEPENLKLTSTVIGTRRTEGVWDENWPWRRSWRARCPWEVCACTPCSPPPPCSNGCRAGTWSRTEYTNINKDMRQRHYSHRQQGKHIYFCHSLTTRWNLELGHEKHRQRRCRERMWTVGYMETK